MRKATRMMMTMRSTHRKHTTYQTITQTLNQESRDCPIPQSILGKFSLTKFYPQKYIFQTPFGVDSRPTSIANSKTHQKAENYKGRSLKNSCQILTTFFEQKTTRPIKMFNSIKKEPRDLAFETRLQQHQNMLMGQVTYFVA